MIPQSKGKMFLAEERGCCEMDWFRSYSTFNFGIFQQEHKSAAGALYLLNDDTLAGQRSLSLTVEEPSDILLLPVVGAVSCSTSQGYADGMEAGQCVRLYATPGTTVQIDNPYNDELVNFVQLWLKQPAPFSGKHARSFSFDLNNNRNQLIELFPGETGAARHYIGKFTGRAEWTHTITPSNNALFVFVIEGAFEVQYRLLHARDGLLLWDTQEAELEALSNDAIILVSEITMND